MKKVVDISKSKGGIAAMAIAGTGLLFGFLWKNGYLGKKTSQGANNKKKSIYDRIGGQAAVDKAVDMFYDRMEKD